MVVKRIRPVVALATAAVAAVLGSALGSTPGANASAATASAATTKNGWIALVTPSGAVQLLSPSGTRQRITTVDPAAYDIRDVSVDGRRFLFSDGLGRVAVYDAGARKWSHFRVGQSADVRLTRPTGAAVLATVWDPHTGATLLQRWSIGGAFQATLNYPNVVTGPQVVLPSADGLTYISSGSAGGGLEVHENAKGTPIKNLPMPNGYLCGPRRWWDAGTVLAACSKTGDYVAMNIWKIPLDGRPPTQLSGAGTDRAEIDWGWKTPSGPIVARGVYLCGPAEFGILEGGVIAHPVSFGHKRPDLVGLSGNRMVMTVTDGCEGGSVPTLVTQDVRTGARVAYGTIDSAVVIDARS